jgi:cytochrome c5
MDTDLNKCYRRRVSTRLTSAAVLAFTLTAGPWIAAQQAAAPAPPAADPHATVDKYCVNCHSDRLKSGGLSLDNMNYRTSPRAPASGKKPLRRYASG